MRRDSRRGSGESFICREANEEAFRAMLRLQIEYEMDTAATVDGSWKEVQGEDGKPGGKRATRAWLLDDGTEGGGQMVGSLEMSNYTGELMAQTECV